MKAFLISALAVATLFPLHQSTQGAVTVTLEEINGGVTLSYGGTLDLTGLAYSDATTNVDAVSRIFGDYGISGLRSNLSDGGPIRLYEDPWVSADSVASATVLSDSKFTQQIALLTALISVAPSDLTDEIWSGSGSTVFNGKTISEVVSFTSPVVWTLKETGDTVTWQTIPEPGTTALAVGAGLGHLALLRRKR